eukprot:TCONS_00027086-protein
MSSSPRVFVVTGANKGIGKSIVKRLLQDKEEKTVYLTARNEELGLQTVKEFEQNGLKPRFHQLDITDQNSIGRLHDYLKSEHGGLNVLVNNAGVAFRGDSPLHGAKTTVGCNYFGLMNIFNSFFPLLKQNGVVVNISSVSSVHAYKRLSDGLKRRFSDSGLTVDALSILMNEFITATEDQDTFEATGWPTSAYGVSKMGVSFLTQLQQKSFDAEEPNRNIKVNSCCPGLVETDMTRGKHEKSWYQTPEEGADTPVYLSLLQANDDSIKGCFCQKRKPTTYPPQETANS